VTESVRFDVSVSVSDENVTDELDQSVRYDVGLTESVRYDTNTT
jgi:hypothetical protein